MTWLLFGSHAPWHTRVTLLQVIRMTASERLHCPSALRTQRHMLRCTRNHQVNTGETEDDTVYGLPGEHEGCCM